MLVIAGTIQVTPEDIERNRDAINIMCAESNKEEGCHAYAFSADLGTPGLIRVFESWESQEALDAHFATPHMAAFQAALATATVSGMDILKYQIESVGPMAAPGR